MKKLGLLLVAFIILANVLVASADEDVKYYVFDEAEILNDETEGYISVKSRKVIENLGINITVVTHEEAKISDYDRYFRETAEEYGIESGILILIAENLGSIATYSTEGMKKLISDEKLAYIRQNCIPGLQDGELDFDKAILNLYRSVLIELGQDIAEKPIYASRAAYLNFIMILPVIAGYCILVILVCEVFLKKMFAIYKARRRETKE